MTDDILVFDNTADEHHRNLMVVLKLLNIEASLRICRNLNSIKKK